MKPFYSFIVFFLFTISLSAQVSIRSNFESGAIGAVERVDSSQFIIAPGDTIGIRSYGIRGSYDPYNIVDTSLAASPRWFYFCMTGVKNQLVYITFFDTDPMHPQYSYDNVNWQPFSIREASFRKISKRFDRDTVYISYFQPYTVSYLQERIDEWCSREGTSVDSIGYSCQGRPLQLLHITDSSVDASQKFKIWIHGRQHPSEASGSYALDGFIDLLTSETPIGIELRKHIDAYILPFTNPDGVYLGLSRSNSTGVNQEINFNRSIDSTVVEVHFIKEALEKLTAEGDFDIALNIHAQIANFASYWIHTAQSTSSDFLRRELVLADLTCSMNDYIIPENMQFSKVAPRYPEGWFWNKSGEKTLALTFELPYTFESKDLRLFGERLLLSVAEYCGISLPGRIIVKNPDSAGSKWISAADSAYTFMGNSGWISLKKGAKMRYSLEYLEKGEYDVYMYTPAPNDEKECKGERGWRFIGKHTQKENGRFNYQYKSVGASEGADDLLLISNCLPKTL